MTITAAHSTTRIARVDSTRMTALVAGFLYLITFAASIPAAFIFLAPVLTNPDYIVSAGSDTGVVWGCVLDVIKGLSRRCSRHR